MLINTCIKQVSDKRDCVKYADTKSTSIEIICTEAVFTRTASIQDTKNVYIETISIKSTSTWNIISANSCMKASTHSTDV